LKENNTPPWETLCFFRSRGCLSAFLKLEATGFIFPPEAGFGHSAPAAFAQKVLKQVAGRRKPTPISGLTYA